MRKARKLRKKGKRKLPNKLRSLTREVTPEYIVVAGLTVFWPAWLPIAFHNVEDFTLSNDNGVEFVTLAENPTKRRQAGLRVQPKSVVSKLFATDESRYPVAPFLRVVYKRGLKI